ncbi:MAG: hypothetical protein P4L92_23745 [Rudaea sp.]|nr:hypothetical protein [Rudaea sp.]
MTPRSPNLRWQPWLLWSGVLLLGIGFIAERSWRSLPLPRALETLLLGLCAWTVASLLRHLLRISLASALLCVFASALTCFIGALPLLATLILAAGGFSLGRIVAGASDHTAITTVAGIGALAGVLGWLLPFPLHFRLVYLLLLLLLCIAGRRHLHTALRSGAAAWREAVAETPVIAAFAVAVAGLASAGCWLPTVQFDDLAYHLGFPAQLAALGYYRMDVHSQVWALAPWSGDIVQATAQLLAGEEARGAVDAFWLLAAATLTWELAAALGTPPFARWLCVALVASLPLTAGLVGGMQAELPAAAASLALALTAMSAAQNARIRQLFLFALLAGFLLGLKTGFVAIIVPLSAWLAWRWRGQWSWKLVVPGLGLIFLVGGSSHVYAAVLTGNPLFPLLNGLFHSSLFSEQNLADPRWTAPVGWDILWQLTFHTRAYLEGWDGAAGFFPLALSGAFVLALGAPRLRPLAVAGLVAFVAAIMTVHYLRYTYPALMLLAPVAVAAVAMTTSRRRATVLLITLTVLDLAYQTCSYWTLHVGGVKRTLLQADGEPVIEHLAPERALIRIVRSEDATANVLLCSPDAPFAAELAGRGFVTAWYDPELRRAREAADADPGGDGWRGIFAYTGARYAIVSDTAPSAALAAALASAQPLRKIESVQLWKLPLQPADRIDLVRERDLASAKLWP